MDTRQLAAFCAVVERKSFSQAAERLGVTQPAVSLQIRSLEQRLGRQLLDRSGRRVEPTEAGLHLYRNAQRLLALEEQLLDELTDTTGELRGRLALGASSGPGETVLPLLLCDFQREHPGVHVALSVSDTQTVVDLVARRELELGVVGAARRHRSVVFEPFFRDEVVLACPPGHRFAGRTVTPTSIPSRGRSCLPARTTATPRSTPLAPRGSDGGADNLRGAAPLPSGAGPRPPRGRRRARGSHRRFRAPQRSLPYLLGQLLLIIPLVWGFTPLIRPLRWWRLALTYLVPILPLLILWDGVVSSLRTYAPADLEKLTTGLGGDGYHWRSGVHRVRGWSSPISLGSLAARGDWA